MDGLQDETPEKGVPDADLPADPPADAPAPLPADPGADTAPQPVLGPAALAAAAEQHLHERRHGAHAAVVSAGTGAPVEPPHPVHHHEVDGGRASHLAPHHEARPSQPRRRALVAGVLAATLLVVGALAAWAALSPRGTQAAPQPSTTPAPTSPVGASDVDPTSAPGAPAAPMLPPAQDTLVLGDSLGLTVYPWLADLVPDRYVSYEAKVGRTTSGTLAALRQMRSIPPVVIVSSGTNDPTATGLESDATQILDLLGPERCVVWVDVVRPDSAYDSADELNAALARATEGRENVSILRWTSLIEAHPDWMGGDGIHPGEAGAQGRAAAFAGATQACSPTDPDAPTARKQYIPLSEFYGPVAGGGSGGPAGGGSGTSTSSTPAPTMTSSPPQSSPAATEGSGAPTTSGSTAPPPPPPSTSTPPATSETPAPSGSAAAQQAPPASPTP